MVEKTVPIPREHESATSQETLRTPDRYSAPPVDIYETADGLVVVADLPGVQKGGLEVRVEDDVLTIKGHPNVPVSGDEVYREYTLRDFFRQFELTDRVNQDGISANLQHGVLTLTLPKAEKTKPRRIPVEIG